MADFNPSVFGVPTKPSGSTQEPPKFQIGGAPLVPTGGVAPPKNSSTQAALFGVPGAGVSTPVNSPASTKVDQSGYDKWSADPSKQSTLAAYYSALNVG